MPNALAVVAHHDDHVLWMGGTIQRLKANGWNWTLVAMCVPDPIKQTYYDSCCEAYDVPGFRFDYKDYQGSAVFGQNNAEMMKTTLIDKLGGQNFDHVFTHSCRPNREYGHHSNHAEVELVVSSLVQDKRLGCTWDHVAYFCYEWNNVGGTATAASPSALYYLQLNYEELSKKLEWCKKIPDLGSMVGLAYPCPNPEAFEGRRQAMPINLPTGTDAANLFRRSSRNVMF